MSDRAWVDGDDVVRAMTAQAEPVLVVDSELDPGTPSQPVAAVDRLDDDLEVEAGETLQLLAHDASLELALRAELDVLEVAPAALARAGVGAAPLHPPGSGPQHLDRVRAQVACRRCALGDDRPHPLPREGVPDEDHPTFVARDEVPAVRDGFDVDLDDPPDEGCVLRSHVLVDSHP